MEMVTRVHRMMMINHLTCEICFTIASPFSIHRFGNLMCKQTKVKENSFKIV